MKTRLFLHMGPGFHSQIEKDLFESRYPDVEFWSQPPSENMNQLTEAAQEKALELYRVHSQPLTLIAHSFGGQLARLITQVHPEVVSGITLVNSAENPFECFINLSGHTQPKHPAVDFELLRRSSVSDKINFIIGLASAPNLAELYWHSKKKMLENAPLFSKYPQLDVNVFLKVFSDFLERRDNLFHENSTWKGSVKIFYAENDLLLDKNKDINPWLALFPQADLFVYSEGGHYLHLEDSKAAHKIFG